MGEKRGGGSGSEGEEERRAAKLGLRTGREEKKRELARGHGSPHSPAFAEALSPSERRATTSRGLQVLRGSRARRSVRRAAGSLALARGVGGGGRRRRRPRPLEAAGDLGVGSGGQRRAGGHSFYSSSVTACCHRLRSRVGAARSPGRPPWLRGNLSALRAAPTPPPPAWRRPRPPSLPRLREPLLVPHLLLRGSPRVTF